MHPFNDLTRPEIQQHPSGFRSSGFPMYPPTRRQIENATKRYDRRHTRNSFPVGLLLLIILGCFGLIVWLCTGGGN
jgi:hypothetical protein